MSLPIGEVIEGRMLRLKKRPTPGTQDRGAAMLRCTPEEKVTMAGKESHLLMRPRVASMVLLERLLKRNARVFKHSMWLTLPLLGGLSPSGFWVRERGLGIRQSILRTESSLNGRLVFPTELEWVCLDGSFPHSKDAAFLSNSVGWGCLARYHNGI